jgi:hypothetical protein
MNGINNFTLDVLLLVLLSTFLPFVFIFFPSQIMLKKYSLFSRKIEVFSFVFCCTDNNTRLYELESIRVGFFFFLTSPNRRYLDGSLNGEREGWELTGRGR